MFTIFNQQMPYSSYGRSKSCHSTLLPEPPGSYSGSPCYVCFLKFSPTFNCLPPLNCFRISNQNIRVFNTFRVDLGINGQMSACSFLYMELSMSLKYPLLKKLSSVWIGCFVETHGSRAMWVYRCDLFSILLVCMSGFLPLPYRFYYCGSEV